MIGMACPHHPRERRSTRPDTPLGKRLFEPNDPGQGVEESKEPAAAVDFAVSPSEPPPAAPTAAADFAVSPSEPPPAALA